MNDISGSDKILTADLHRRLGHPMVLLLLTGFIWAGNTIAGRLLVGESSPMATTTFRWLISFLLLSLFVRNDVIAMLPLFRTRALYLFVMGLIGFTGFNAIYYYAAQFTYAVNLGIMQSSTPIFVMLGAALVQKIRVTPGQVVGLIAGIVGVLWVASAGRWEVIRTLDFNRGDVMILAVSALYASYSLGLKHRPETISGIGFFAAMAAVAVLTSLPLLALEMAQGTFKWPTLKGWIIIAWVGIFPSLLAQIWYIRAIAALGPTRSGFIFNLIPVFAALQAVVLLGEPFGWHHAIGLTLVLGGIAWAEKHKGH